jgi:hypothetical protein
MAQEERLVLEVAVPREPFRGVSHQAGNRAIVEVKRIA